VLRSGARPVPTLHLLDAARPRPYLGAVVCRGFTPGGDAAAAVAAMGQVAAAAGATRVVASWDHADLPTPAGIPGSTGDDGVGEDPGMTEMAWCSAVLLLDAEQYPCDPGRDVEQLRWHPDRLEATPGPWTGPRPRWDEPRWDEPRWDVPVADPSRPLPSAIDALLRAWRHPDTLRGVEAGPRGVSALQRDLAAAGHGIYWAPTCDPPVVRSRVPHVQAAGARCVWGGRRGRRAGPGRRGTGGSPR